MTLFTQSVHWTQTPQGWVFMDGRTGVQALACHDVMCVTGGIHFSPGHLSAERRAYLAYLAVMSTNADRCATHGLHVGEA